MVGSYIVLEYSFRTVSDLNSKGTMIKDYSQIMEENLRKKKGFRSRLQFLFLEIFCHPSSSLFIDIF